MMGYYYYKYLKVEIVMVKKKIVYLVPTVVISLFEKVVEIQLKRINYSSPKLRKT